MIKHKKIWFATREWFDINQPALLFLVNNKLTKEYFRDKLKLTQVDLNAKVTKLTPNAVIYNLDAKNKGGYFYSGNRYEWAIKREFERLLLPFHKWDIRFANVFAPALNLGYDTLQDYSTTSDGHIYHQSSPGGSWASVRDAVTGTTAVTNESSQANAFQSNFDGVRYNSRRSWFYHDTSAIGAGATISLAQYNLYGASFNGAQVEIQEGTQAATLTTADWDSFTGNYFSLLTSWNTSGYNTFTLDSAGETYVNNNASCLICGREYLKDYSNVAPTGLIRSGCYYSDNPDVGNDPYVYIEYTTGGEVINSNFFLLF